MIRRLGLHDASLLRSLRIRALTDSPSAFGSTLDVTLQRPLADWQYMLRADGNPFFVYEVGGHIHGLAGGFVPEEPGIVHLVSMWIDPAHRGRGVSDALVRHVIEWAASIGATRVSLECTEGNAHAEALYVRHGFRRTGTAAPRERDGAMEFEMVLEVTDPLR